MPKSGTEAMVAIMGVTGTGKSTFIRLLTNDENIHIGHDLESMTFDVVTSRYVDKEAGVRATLVDTPGFDDSREGVSDTDILGKIANFLQDNGGRTLNGIIYLHRISDPRFSGMAKKNLRVFRELCGDDNLGHVRFVTTYWNVVSEKEGKDREAALANGVFRPFIDAGARLIRHDGGFESAKKIISDLARQTPVTMKIQKELNAGMVLGDTSAGAVIVEETKELQKRHAEEMEELKKELEEAANENDDDLKAELDEERRKLAERIAQVAEDRKRLAMLRLPSETRPLPQVESANYVSTAMYTMSEAPVQPQKGKGLDGEQANRHNRAERNGRESREDVQNTLPDEEGQERQQRREENSSLQRPPVHNSPQNVANVNGERIPTTANRSTFNRFISWLKEVCGKWKKS
ncbi:hypothetical protein APHAL10511_001406 [Amanita phalloides]|nr:hypothetical protein APHAL10511_001406 [Amanita phalloides]